MCEKMSQPFKFQFLVFLKSNFYFYFFIDSKCWGQFDHLTKLYFFKLFIRKKPIKKSPRGKIFRLKIWSARDNLIRVFLVDQNVTLPDIYLLFYFCGNACILIYEKQRKLILYFIDICVHHPVSKIIITKLLCFRYVSRSIKWRLTDNQFNL